MFITNDIYYKMYQKLEKHDFEKQTLERKIELIDHELINFMKEKLLELNIDSTSNDSYQLFKELSNTINSENKELLLSQFTHYLLNCISSFQGYEIVWYSSIEEDLREFPELEFKNGYCDSLHTLLHDDELKVFTFVHDIFKNLGKNNIPIEHQKRLK